MGKTRKDQASLFDLRCVLCDKRMERTPGGFLACPRGHGKLHQDEAAELPYEGISLFPDEEVA